MTRREAYPPQELSEAALGYLAGLIDGEGWLGLHRRKRSWKRTHCGRSYYLRPVISIGMATREALDHVAAMLGLGLYVKVEGALYVLRIYPTTLRWLLPQLIPHLRLKRRHAEILRDFTERLRYQGKELTVEEFLQRETLGEAIRQLNERPAARRRREALAVERS